MPAPVTMERLDEELGAELAHWVRRSERLHALLKAGRYDPLGTAPERAEYADGVAYGLGLALMAMRGARALGAS